MYCRSAGGGSLRKNVGEGAGNALDLQRGASRSLMVVHEPPRRGSRVTTEAALLRFFAQLSGQASAQQSSSADQEKQAREPLGTARACRSSRASAPVKSERAVTFRRHGPLVGKQPFFEG